MTSRRIPLDTTAPESSVPSPASASLPAEVRPPLNLNPEEVARLREEVIGVLHTCFDPEVPANIYELGLIYHLDVQPTGAVAIQMTLTTPACPVAGSLPPEVQRKVQALPNVSSARVEVVWDPPWTTERMSEAAKLQLGID